jgi:hypothetical protein
MSYSAWSAAFSTDSVEQTRVYVSESEWRRIHDEYSDAQRIFARLIVDDKDIFCPLGEPIGMSHFGKAQNKECIIIPNWALISLGIDGSGEDVEITWLAEDAFPNATRVILRPHDSAFFHGDIKEELERELTTYGVLMEGTTIHVAVQSLDGFPVQMDVVRTYPANVVLLDGDEIAFEFETALDVPEAPVTPEVVPAFPYYETVPVAEPAVPVADTVIPVAEPLAGPIGHRLGGVNHAPLPDGRLWNPWR